MNESCLTYEWVMSHIWMSHVSHMNESCLSCEWMMRHIWVNRLPYMNAPCLIWMNEWGITHIWTSHVTYMNASCHLYEWVMAHTYMDESCHTYEWLLNRGLHSSPDVTDAVHMDHVSHMNESCLTYEWQQGAAFIARRHGRSQGGGAAPPVPWLERHVPGPSISVGWWSQRPDVGERGGYI